MAKKFVSTITSQTENFAQWYTDVCVKAELMSYSDVKGFIIYRPYGYAIWENIQQYLNTQFKQTKVKVGLRYSVCFRDIKLS